MAGNYKVIGTDEENWPAISRGYHTHYTHYQYYCYSDIIIIIIF